MTKLKKRSVVTSSLSKRAASLCSLAKRSCDDDRVTVVALASLR